MQQKLEEIRCGACARKLGMGCYTQLEIKCPRCGALNILRATPADSGGQRPPPERLRASNNGANHGKAIDAKEAPLNPGPGR